jgi:hypothetical protein
MNVKGIIAAGASLLWRRQRVLWWLFAMNFAVGVVATVPVRTQLRALDSSMAARDSLYRQMNVFRLIEALSRPEGLPRAFYGNSVLVMFAYSLFLLFAVGGVLESFCRGRTLGFGEFLRVSAGYFWRMVRLLIVFAIVLIPLLAAHAGIQPLTEWIGSHSDSEQLGFWVKLALHLVVGFAFLAVRVWIDIAQIDCVAQDEIAVRRSLGRTRRLLYANFWRMYGAVTAVQVLLLTITFLLLLLWLRLPHEAIGGTFLIGELIVLLWLGFRLWQKAAETAWYQQRVLAEAQPVVAAERGVEASPVDLRPTTFDLPTK